VAGTVEPLDRDLLRVFERVASLAGISAAARALGSAKSNVSRGVARLEATLHARFFQRTARHVVLTATGESLHERCAVLLEGLGEAIEYVSGFADAPNGRIKVSAGVGFGVDVLAEIVPRAVRELGRRRESGGEFGCRRDLDSVAEFGAFDDLRQLVPTWQPAPGFRRRHRQLEDHRAGGVLRQRVFHSDGATPDGCEDAFDRVRGAKWSQ
jgi:DNA-binding transcriptional LysR family regulator